MKRSELIEDSIRIVPIGPHSQVILIEVYGSLNAVVSFQFQEKVKKLVEKGFIRYVLNFEHLEDMSSAGVGVLSGLALALQKYNGKMVFVHVPEKVYHLFKITRLIEMFHLTDSIENAVAMLKETSQET